MKCEDVPERKIINLFILRLVMIEHLVLVSIIDGGADATNSIIY